MSPVTNPQPNPGPDDSGWMVTNSSVSSSMGVGTAGVFAGAGAGVASSGTVSDGAAEADGMVGVTSASGTGVDSGSGSGSGVGSGSATGSGSGSDAPAAVAAARSASEMSSPTISGSKSAKGAFTVSARSWSGVNDTGFSPSSEGAKVPSPLILTDSPLTSVSAISSKNVLANFSASSRSVAAFAAMSPARSWNGILRFIVSSFYGAPRSGGNALLLPGGQADARR